MSDRFDIRELEREIAAKLSKPRSEPFWRHPRGLAELLRDGTITQSTFVLVNVVGEQRNAEPDRKGFHTTLGDLAAWIGRSERTVRRALDQAREVDLLVNDRHQGRAGFRVWLGPEMLVDERTRPVGCLGRCVQLRTRLRSKGGGPFVRS